MANLSAPEITEFKLESIDVVDVLEKLSILSVDDVASEVQNYFPLNNQKLDQESLLIIATGITLSALKYPDLRSKYIELAIKLSSLHLKDEEGTVTLKNVLFMQINEIFGDFVKKFNTMDEQNRINYGSFFAQFFFKDLIPSTVIIQWMFLLAEKPAGQIIILDAIESKIQSTKSGSDKFIDALKEMIRERKEQTTPTNIVARFQTKRTNETGQISSNGNQIPLMARFEFYLKNINQSKKSDLDLQKFTTLSDDEKRNCAVLMLSQALIHSENIVDYAKLAREIICNYSVEFRYHQTFGEHLCELCETEINRLFSERFVRDWSRIKNLGVFLGEIYVRQGLKNDVINKWLNNVHQQVVAEYNVYALDALFAVLEIIFTTMKQRDPKNYKSFFQYLSQLAVEGKFPAEYIKWGKSVLNPNSFVTSETSVSSCKIKDSKASSTTNQQAFDKKSPSTTQPERALKEMKKIQEKFKRFLCLIEVGEVVSFESKQLDSCSEQAQGACAHILLTSALYSPNNAKVYAELAKHRNPVFVQHLLQNFVTSVPDFFESPDKKWDGGKTGRELLQNSIKFVCELYNFDVADINLMNKMIEDFYRSLMRKNKILLAPFLLIFVNAGEKLKKHDSIAFDNFTKRVAKLPELIIFPEEHKELAQAALKICDDHKCSNQSPAPSECEKHKAPNPPNLKSFKTFLRTIDQNTNPQFDVSQLEAIKEDIRMSCAKAILGHVENYPNNIIAYAEVAKNILNNCNKKSKLDEKTLSGCLIEACHGECGRIFAMKNNRWEIISNFGVFVSELYIRSKSIRSVIKRWLKNVSSSVENNNSDAIKTLLTSLRLILTELKRCDLKMYQLYFQHLRVLTDKQMIPKEFVQWTDSILNSSSNEVAEGSSESTITKLSNVKNDSNSLKETEKLHELRTIVNKMNFGNHAYIVSEIARCGIDNIYCTISKVVNILILKALERTDLEACVSEVLAKLPSSTSPPLNVANFMGYVGASLFDEYKKLVESLDVIETTNIDRLIPFTKELLMRSIINSDTITEIRRYLILNNFSDKAGYTILRLFNDTFKEELVEAPSNASLINEILSTAEDVPKPSSSEDAPKINKLNAPLQSNIMEDFHKQLLELEGLEANKVEEMIGSLKIGNLSEMKTFAASFFTITMEKKNFVVYARLGQLIDNTFVPVTTEISFKKSLLELVQMSLKKFQSEKFEKVLSKEDFGLVKFTGELYKLGWISRDQLVGLMDKLTINSLGTSHHLMLFNDLLQIISVALISNGESELCAGYLDVLNGRDKHLTKADQVAVNGAIRNMWLLELEVKEILKNIITLSRTSINDESVISTLSDTNCDNLVEKAEKIVRIISGNSKQINDLGEALMARVFMDSEEAVLCARLAHEILKAGNSTIRFKEILIELCQENLLNNLNSNTVQSKEMTCFLNFVGELYILNVFNFNFIHLCFDLMFDEREGAVECFATFIKKIGSKFDIRNSSKLDEQFKKLESVVSKGNLSLVPTFQELIMLRNNGWVPQNEQESDIFNVQRISESRFIITMWENLMINSELVSHYAKLCKEFTEESSSSQEESVFTTDLMNFLHRCVKMSAYPTNGMHSEVTNNQFTTVMLLIGELYKYEVISDREFENLLKPAKRLPFDVLNTLISVIAPKINSSGNARLIAILMVLEDFAAERTKKAWMEIRKGIAGLGELFIQQ